MRKSKLNHTFLSLVNERVEAETKIALDRDNALVEQINDEMQQMQNMINSRKMYT